MPACADAGVPHTVQEKTDTRAVRLRKGRTRRPSAFAEERYEKRNGVERTVNKLKHARAVATCRDKPGYMELDRRGAELLFHVLTEREEQNSVAVASNESFSRAHMFR